MEEEDMEEEEEAEEVGEGGDRPYLTLNYLL